MNLSNLICKLKNFFKINKYLFNNLVFKQEYIVRKLVEEKKTGQNIENDKKQSERH